MGNVEEVAVVAVPESGAYITDGKRLLEVLYMDDSGGHIVCEDCMMPTDAKEVPEDHRVRIAITRLNDWRVVESPEGG